MRIFKDINGALNLIEQSGKVRWPEYQLKINPQLHPCIAATLQPTFLLFNKGH